MLEVLLSLQKKNTIPKLARNWELSERLTRQTLPTQILASKQACMISIFLNRRLIFTKEKTYNIHLLDQHT